MVLWYSKVILVFYIFSLAFKPCNRYTNINQIKSSWKKRTKKER